MYKVVTFGEILLRLSAEEHKRFAQADKFDAHYGGGEANVAISLSNFGVQTNYVTRIPDNEIGQACIRSLKKFGVGTEHILLGGKRLGLYFLELGAVNRGSKVIYDRDDSAFATLKPGMINWDKAFEGGNWFHWSGLSAAISQSAADVLYEGVLAAYQKGMTISCDINLRSNLWNYGKTSNEIMPPLLEMCDVILGNEYDAEFAMDIEVEDKFKGKFSKESFMHVCPMIMNRYPKVKKIIATRRGSVNASNNSLHALMFDGAKLIESKYFDITHIVDRVGGGDAFTGALIYGLLERPNQPGQILNFAVAASSLKHTISGDANMITIDEVEQLVKNSASGAVISFT